MESIKSNINLPSKEVITEMKTQSINCNSIHKPDFPLSNQVKVHLNSDTIRNQSINHEKFRTSTEFSKNNGHFKSLKHNLKLNFEL